MTNAIKRELINFGLSTIWNLVSILCFAIWYRVFSTQEVRDDVDQYSSVPGRFHCKVNTL